MARWKLNGKHYLNVPGNKWEYTEIDRTTGKPVRKTFPVPTHLNPEEPSDWSHKEIGEIIVCFVGKGQPRDIEFEGDPTPDMIPLNAEAEEISAQYEKLWGGKAIDMPEKGYTEMLLSDLGNKLAEAQTAAASTMPKGMEDLLSTMKTLMEQNAAILAALVPKAIDPVKRI